MYQNVLNAMDVLEKMFGSPTRSYYKTVQALYDCVTELPVKLKADFEYFREVDGQFLFGSSAQSVRRLSKAINDDRNFMFASEFDGARVEEKSFIDWVSNEESLGEYITLGGLLIEGYIKYNRHVNGTPENKPGIHGVVSFDEELIELYTSMVFKTFISEYFSVYRVVIEINMGELE